MNDRSFRALFVGEAGPIPARVLAAWLESGHEVAAYWRTNPNNRRYWRHDRLLGVRRPDWSVQRLLARIGSDPVKAWNLDQDQRIDAARALSADVLISAVGMMIFPQSFLDLFGRNAVNFHPALLPGYRGPSPRTAQIVHETFDRFGGMTMHVLTREIDAGDIVAQRSVPFDMQRGYWRWDVELAEAAGDMTRNELPEYLRGRIGGTAQQRADVSYHRIGRPDWTLTPDDTVRRVRFICEAIGPLDKIGVRAGGRRIYVRRFRRLVGAASGEPPRLTARSLTLDVRDGRVELERWRRTSRLRNEVARLATVLRATRDDRKSGS